jgi:hypothetical protein
MHKLLFVAAPALLGLVLLGSGCADRITDPVPDKTPEGKYQIVPQPRRITIEKKQDVLPQPWDTMLGNKRQVLPQPWDGPRKSFKDGPRQGR